MNLVYETNNTLYHHGVKGMRWGKRKARYITARQGIKKAKAAGEEAWRKTTTEQGGKLFGKSKSIAVYKNPVAKMQGRKAANEAYRKAAKESIQDSKAYNKQARAERKTNKSDDYVRAKSLKKKKISELSNAELKELNNRMQLESQYKNLKRQTISTGEKFIKDVAVEASKEIAKEYTKKYAKKGIELVGMTLGKK